MPRFEGLVFLDVDPEALEREDHRVGWIRVHAGTLGARIRSISVTGRREAEHVTVAYGRFFRREKTYAMDEFFRLREL